MVSCPTGEELQALFVFERDFFRCMNCGADLEQHINGKIIYLPTIIAPKGAKPFVREWLEEDGEKV